MAVVVVVVVVVFSSYCSAIDVPVFCTGLFPLLADDAAREEVL